MYDQEISKSPFTRLASKVQTQGHEDQDQRTKDRPTDQRTKDQTTKGPSDQGTTIPGPKELGGVRILFDTNYIYNVYLIPLILTQRLRRRSDQL